MHHAVADGPGVLQLVAAEGPVFQVLAFEQADGFTVVLRKLFDADVLEVDGHGGTGVDLQGQDAFH